MQGTENLNIRARVKEYAAVVQDLQFSDGIARGSVEVTYGHRYAKIVIHNGQSFVHSFVDLSNGNVLKAATWNGPSLKNPRSNIMNPDKGRSGIEAYGVRYLR